MPSRLLAGCRHRCVRRKTRCATVSYTHLDVYKRQHPVHMHGMWSDLEDAEGKFLVRKHSISIPPGTKRSFRVTADALGRWAFHCHMLMHMEAGIMREVRVEE